MAATLTGDAPASAGDAVIRLRLDVYDALAAKRGVSKRIEQAALHGVSRQQWHRVRIGDRRFPLALAMRVARDFGVPVEVLFEERHP